MKKRRFLNLFIAAVAISVGAGSLYSCKDYDDEMYAELHKQGTTLGEVLDTQIENLGNLKGELEQAKKEAEEKIENLEQNYAKEDQLNVEKARIDALTKKIDQINTILEEKIDKKAKEIYGRIEELALADKEIRKDLEQLGVRVTTIENNYNNIILPKVNDLSDSLYDAYAQAKANEALLTQHDSKLDQLEKDIKTNKDNIEAKLNEAKKYADQAAQEVANELGQDINALTLTVNEMKPIVDKVNAILPEIETLVSDVAALKKQALTNENALAELGLKFDKLESSVNNLITSVVINGAYSPVVGYFALPTGLKSNILAAYYGEAESDVYFPTTSTINYVNPDLAFDAKDQALLGFNEAQPEYFGGDCILEKTNGNAGKLYVTINPTSVDMTGKSFSLVNSWGQDASLNLSTPVPCKDKLSFGYTRATATNNFFEVPATLNESQIQNAKLRLNLNDLKEAAKDVLSPRDGINITNVVNTLYTNINDIADANAIKATWTDDRGEHSVLSDYGIAAVAIKPLSYYFMKDFHRDTFWGMDKAYNLLDRVVAKLNSVLPEFPQFDLTLPVIKQIQIKELDEELRGKFLITIKKDIEYELDLRDTIQIGSVNVEGSQIIIPEKEYYVTDPSNPTDTIGKVTIPADTIDIEGKDVNIPDKIITIKKTITIPVEITHDMRPAIDDLYGDLTESMTDVNKMLADLQKFIDEDLQGLLDQLNGYSKDIETNLDNAIKDMNTKVTNFLNKINNKLCNLVNSVNERIQPVLFVKTVENFNIISEAKNMPSEFPSQFVLAATSHTGELMTPAAKKFVAVTDVIKGSNSARGDNADCVSILKAANNGNADLNSVLAGSQQTIQVQGLKSGYTYEFTYSALDYSGKISNTKYYVTIK